jgi:transcriptional regulator with XRE-family HTH domain
VDSDPGPLARILVRLRGDRGWRQKDVTERAGLEQGYYSSLETGAIMKPSDERLEALDRAFELEPGTLNRWLREGPPWAPKHPPIISENPLMEVLAPGPNGEFVALVRRVPASRQREAAEIIRRQVTEMLKVLAEDSPES